MSLVTAIIIIIIFITLYFLIIEIFTTLFRTTGLTKEKSRYQSISLFTNCGFTTSESELITSNRRRKRIATVLMIIGHVFSVIIVSLLVALMGTFNASELQDNYIIKIIILASFVSIIFIFKLPFVSKPIARLLEKVAMKRSLKREKNNIITVLDNYGRESLVEIYLYWVPDILLDKSLMEVNLKRNYNLNLVTVKRGNKVLEVTASTIIQSFDKIIIFGNLEIINDIFKNKNRKIEEDIKTNKVTIIDNYGMDALCEIDLLKVPDILDNKKLSESVIKSKYNIQILMIQDEISNKLTTASSIVKENDKLLVFGPYQNIKYIFRVSVEEEKE